VLGKVGNVGLVDKISYWIIYVNPPTGDFTDLVNIANSTVQYIIYFTYLTYTTPQLKPQSGILATTYRNPAVPLGVEEQEGLLEIRQLILREAHLLRHP